MRGPTTKTLIGMLLATSAMCAAPAFSQEVDGEEERTLGTVRVTGMTEFFRPTEATTATKIPLAIVETPQAITVLTEDIIDITGARDLEDTAGLVPGFVSKGTYGGFDNRFNARGFDISVAEGILINGVQVASNVDRDFLGVERIEFLRGPTSIVLGTLNYGGAVNIITKRPTEDLSGSLVAEIGSFDTYRVEGEISGALNETGTVRGYFGAAYEDRESFRDAQELQKIPLRASLDVDFSDRTSLLVDLGYEDGEGVPTGTFSRVYGNGDDIIPDFIPVEWNSCAFVDGCFNEYTNTDITATLRHEFSDSLYARASLGYAETDRQHKFISFIVLGTFWGPSDIAGLWYTYDDTDTYETIFGEFALGGEFDAFGQTHDFLFLAETRQREIFENYQLQDPSEFNVVASILDPTADTMSGETPIFIQETAPWQNTTRDEDSIALTAQAVLRPTDRLQLLLGARFEEEEFSATGIRGGGNPDFGGFDVDVEESNDDVVFRFGAVYEVADSIFGYASYSEGFLPQSGAFATSGDTIPPETGTQYEIGLKGEFFDGRFGAGISAFLIERENVPNITGQGILAETNDRSQDHEGVELEFLGELFEGLDLIATYSYLDTEITQADAEPGILGNEVANAPNDLASLFVQYQLPIEPNTLFDGVSIGGGVRYVGDSWVSEDNELTLPGYTLLEANIALDLSPGLRFQLIGRNLTDEEYFQSFLSTGFAGWAYGEPRSVLARLTKDF